MLAKMLLGIFVGCRDVNGICKPIGAIGFSAEVRGQLRPNCTCTQAQNQKIGVNISC